MKAVRTGLAALAIARATVAVRFWSLVANVRLRAHGATVGRRLRVRGPLHLHCHRTGAIRIGDDCRIQSGFAGNPVGGTSRMAIWVGPGGSLRVGDRVGLSNSTIVCMSSISIEDGALLGGDSKVYDTDFHSLQAEERGRPGNPGVRTCPITIGRRAFIGGHSIVLKGVSIGEAAVVGAGSVVRADVPAFQVWAGNPAALVRDLRGGERSRSNGNGELAPTGRMGRTASPLRRRSDMPAGGLPMTDRQDR
jgi:acetyltransferase-like isoleucine patch superfamily enzyme